MSERDSEQCLTRYRFAIKKLAEQQVKLKLSAMNGRRDRTIRDRTVLRSIKDELLLAYRDPKHLCYALADENAAIDRTKCTGMAAVVAKTEWANGWLGKDRFTVSQFLRQKNEFNVRVAININLFVPNLFFAFIGRNFSAP